MTRAVMTILDKKADPRIQTLRSLFRNLQAFRAVYETDGISQLTGPDGVVWVLWDLEELYRVAVKTELLPERQRQAIEFFLVQNLSEADVARIMSIKASNPVGMYSTSGIIKLLQAIDDGRVVNPWADNDNED